MAVSIDNYLTSTSYSLSFKSPDGHDIACDVQAFTHPTVTVTSATQSTPRRLIPIPGDKLEFDPLNVSMLLDENFTVYKEIVNWINSHVLEDDTDNFKDKMVDVKLHVRNNQGNSTTTITYHNAFPVNIGSLDFNSADEIDSFFRFDVIFMYSHFTIS